MVRQILHSDRLQRQTDGGGNGGEGTADQNATLSQQLCIGVTGPGPTTCTFTGDQGEKVTSSLSAARNLADQALRNLSTSDPNLRSLAARIFDVPSPDMSALIVTTQQIISKLGLPIVCGTCHDPSCNPGAGGTSGGQAAAYVPPDLGSIVVCPFFFSHGAEQMRRTLLHEAGHAAGIDAGSVDEQGQYQHPQSCPEDSSGCLDPCAAVSNRLQNVDVWARFLECAAVSTAPGETPAAAPAEAPAAATARAPADARWSASAGAGLDVTPDAQRLGFALGGRYSFNTGEFVVFNPVLGFNLLYLPPSAFNASQLLAATYDIGLRIQQPLEGLYVDVSTGLFGGFDVDPAREQPAEPTAGGIGTLGLGWRWRRLEVGAEARALVPAGELDRTNVLVFGRTALRFP